MDPLYYAAYARDDEPPEAIERKFAILEQRIQENSNTSTVQDIARKLLAEEALPNQLPTDIWFDLEDEVYGPIDSDEGDASFLPSYGGGDDEEYYVERSLRTKGKKKSKTSHPTLSTSTQVEHLGSGVDLWPLYKVLKLHSNVGMIPHRDFVNRETFRTREEFVEELTTPKYVVDNIDVHTFVDIVGTQVDAIIMDPPFGHNGWDGNKLYKFISGLMPHLSRTFIVIWVDPDTISDIVASFKKAEYVFCDSISVELLDPFGRPYVIYTDSSGFPRDSRMAIMYRTNDIIRSDLKQQRVKDTGYGIVCENGKSYGRISMPLTIHNILKIMLPDRKEQKRVFVELWPSFYARPENWLYIDEKEVDD
ncbi:hypothetical protein GPJ56_006495 [Histomonas meleagridis]|uniref:uncharacterized protein n=1 Tax=Histomonas meleagridis TaxID=135588 RepID=UPI00355A16C0|nr:hypothetical protein GPJ56_006495 [Histomonas meleagridis]KAH0798864.1 hypothetical protein GO595_008350 [Histomonas meleagridis]